MFSVFSFSFAWALSPSTPAESRFYNSVVFISVPAVDVDGSDVTGYCNATLINRTSLVTAAHCVVNSKLSLGQPLMIEVGEYKYKQTPSGPLRVGYVSTLKHKSLVTLQLRPGVDVNRPSVISPEDDFAVITLKNQIPLPQDFSFPQIWKKSVSNAETTQAFVVSINPLENMQNTDTRRGAVLNQIDFRGYSAHSTSAARVQEGDSGAPLFATIGAQIYLVGVVKGRAETYFSNYDVFSVWENRLP